MTPLDFLWNEAGYLITGSIVAGLAYPFARMVIKYKLKMWNQKEKAKQTDNEMMNLLNAAINNPNATLELIEKQIAQFKQSGMTDQQLWGLYMKKQLCQFAIANPELAKFAGPPIAEAGMTLINEIPKLIKKVIKGVGQIGL